MIGTEIILAGTAIAIIISWLIVLSYILDFRSHKSERDRRRVAHDSALAFIMVEALIIPLAIVAQIGEWVND